MTTTLTPPPITNTVARSRPRVMADLAFAVALYIGTFLGVLVLAVLLWTIYDKGWSRLADDPVAFFSNFTSRFPLRAGIKAAVYGTAWLMGLTILFSVPVGVGAAVYLEEFAPKNRLTRFIEANIANLAGVPSVVYGILGLGMFVRFMNLGPTVLAGGLTLAAMSLPVIVIAAREAVRAVPDGVRLASFGLGATKWQTVRHQVLPSALPGILTGAILSLSRAMGETAPLLVVGATVGIYSTPQGLDDRFSALPMVIFNWTERPQAGWAAAAAAASIVLLAMLLAMNAVAIFLRNRFGTRW